MPSEYAANMRAMTDMENMIKLVEKGESIHSLVTAITTDPQRAAEFIMFQTAYIHSLWEQLPQAGVMWAMAKDAMRRERN